jgi:hypothetical protein
MKMTLWIHSAILAASLAATVAVGIASAAITIDAPRVAAAKTDRLPLVADSNATYMTVETRRDGVSVLKRVPTNQAD